MATVHCGPKRYPLLGVCSVKVATAFPRLCREGPNPHASCPAHVPLEGVFSSWVLNSHLQILLIPSGLYSPGVLGLPLKDSVWASPARDPNALSLILPLSGPAGGRSCCRVDMEPGWLGGWSVSVQLVLPVSTTWSPEDCSPLRKTRLTCCLLSCLGPQQRSALNVLPPLAPLPRDPAVTCHQTPGAEPP